MTMIRCGRDAGVAFQRPAHQTYFRKSFACCTELLVALIKRLAAVRIVAGKVTRDDAFKSRPLFFFNVEAWHFTKKANIWGTRSAEGRCS